MLHVAADQVMSQPGLVDGISAAVSAGATGVILTEGKAASSNIMYEAAVKLKAVLRDRAALLLVDRTDLAIAAEADGVLLTQQGLPTVVARRMRLPWAAAW